MTAPRLEIDLDKIQHNAKVLVSRLGTRGIAVTGVTKAVLGSPKIAGALLRAGVQGLGDSRIENIETMRKAHVQSPMTLIRSPMQSQIDRVVAHADASCNTELEVISRLSSAAQRAHRTHGVVLMVELGDLREGIMPVDLEETVRETLRLPNLVFKGIGANLACRSGVSPGPENMAELSQLADSVDEAFGPTVTTVSGGNSSSISWVLGSRDVGRVNDLRLGESVLLGCDPLDRQRIDGLHTDAFALVAEVIESKRKPADPWGETGQNAFGEQPVASGLGPVLQTILALGRQDADPGGLQAPPGIEILGASSDHLVTNSGGDCCRPGTEVRFGVNYSALLRAMTSPFVAKVLTGRRIE